MTLTPTSVARRNHDCTVARLQGYNWQETLELAMWADREVVSGLPAHVRIGIHVCRGNNQGRYVAEGALDPVAEALFSLPYDSFLIEWEDKSRMGDYAALRHVPKDRDSVVVLGLVRSAGSRGNATS